MTKRFLLSTTVVLLLLSGSDAQAQTGALVSAQLEAWSSGQCNVTTGACTGTPAGTQTFTVSTATMCNQTPLVLPAIVVNPNKLAWTDDQNVGKDCIASLTAITLPQPLPTGTGYRVTVMVTDDLGQVSPRSAPSNPFNQQAAPTARTGVRVSR